MGTGPGFAMLSQNDRIICLQCNNYVQAMFLQIDQPHTSFLSCVAMMKSCSYSLVTNICF